MRERLIQLISNADEECKHSKDCKSCSGYGKGSQCMNYHIADYLIDNGVVVLPCKVGQTVYVVDKRLNVGGCTTDNESLAYRLANAPTADMVEVRHGRWTLHKDGSGICSECKKTQKNVWDCDSWQNYCGHCGARMDGDAE